MRTMAKASVRRSPKARGGFTLIEAALATVIVGVGIVAMVDAQQAFIRSNMWSSHAATGTFLANEIRELTRHLPKHDPVTGLYLEADGNGNSTLRGWGRESGEVSVLDFDDLDDFDGVSFSFFGPSGLDDGQYAGPINAFGEVIPNISAADVRNQIVEAVTRTVAQIQVAERRYAIAVRAVDLAEQNLAVEHARFSLGKSRNVDVLTRQDELRSAQLRAARAIIDWHRASAVLAALTGEILPRYGIALP